MEGQSGQKKAIVTAGELSSFFFFVPLFSFLCVSFGFRHTRRCFEFDSYMVGFANRKKIKKKKKKEKRKEKKEERI
jgi:hypothetical protein